MENPYDHLTVWQGNVDGDKLFYVTNIGRGYLRNTLGIGIEKTTVGASAKSSEGQGLNSLLQLHSNTSGVNPTLHISSHNTDEASLLLTENTENNAYGARLFYDGNSNTFFKIAIGDQGTWTDRFVIHRNGNIGAGTQVPQADFHLKSARANMYIENTDPSNWAYLRIQGPTTNFWDIGQYGDSEHLQFRPRGQSVNRVVFKQNGNVGIGTAEPKTKLHLEGGNNEIRFGSNTGLGGFVGTYQDYIGISLNRSISVGDYNDTGKYHGEMGIVSTDKGSQIRFYTGITKNAYGKQNMTLTEDGNLGIGVSDPSHKLTVNGTIQAKEIKVSLDGLPAPDYVFEKDYNLKSLGETQAYIQQNGHLPGVPSAETMETEGLDLKKMNMILLRKIEELTLHAIQQQQEIDQLKKKIQKIEQP